MKITCVWTRLEIKIEEDEKFLIQKLKRQKYFSSESDTVENFHFINRPDKKLTIQNLTHRKSFDSTFDTLYFFF